MSVATLRVALVHMRHKGTGGTERYLNQTATALAERGHKVTIVCRSRESAPHPDVQFCVLKSRIAIGAAARMWHFAKDVERHVQAEGSDKYDLVYGLGRTWTQDLLRLGGGLVETHQEHALRSAASSLERSRLRWNWKQHWALKVERKAFAPLLQDPSQGPHLIANSHMVRRDLGERYGIAQEQVSVLHNGADVQLFDRERHVAAASQLRQEWGEPDKLWTLFLGTGYRRKGLRTLLKALVEVPEARLAIVGYDSDWKRYQGLAEQLDILPRVRFLGGRRDPQVCFAAADLYCLPTFYDPFANSTGEALASSLPVISTQTNGGSELLEEPFGSVTPAGDEQALAQALRAWLDLDRLQMARPLARARAVAWDHKRAMGASLDLIERQAELQAKA